MMTRDHLHVVGAEPAGLMLAYQVNDGSLNLGLI